MLGNSQYFWGSLPKPSVPSLCPRNKCLCLKSTIQAYFSANICLYLRKRLHLCHWITCHIWPFCPIKHLHVPSICSSSQVLVPAANFFLASLLPQIWFESTVLPCHLSFLHHLLLLSPSSYHLPVFTANVPGSLSYLTYSCSLIMRTSTFIFSLPNFQLLRWQQ